MRGVDDAATEHDPVADAESANDRIAVFSLHLTFPTITMVHKI